MKVSPLLLGSTLAAFVAQPGGAVVALGGASAELTTHATPRPSLPATAGSSSGHRRRLALAPGVGGSVGSVRHRAPSLSLAAAESGVSDRAAARTAKKLARYEPLRGPYERERLQRFFYARPLEFGGRLIEFVRAWYELEAVWSKGPNAEGGVDTRGAALRSKLAELGPVAVKIGQTLSQRPDLIPPEVCDELKALQTANRPYESSKAFRVIADDLNWPGPIAPGVLPPGTRKTFFLFPHSNPFLPYVAHRLFPTSQKCNPFFWCPPPDCESPDSPPLFAEITAEPVASASLGQVYRARTHDGGEVAVKVQRPHAVRQVAKDFAVIATSLWAVAKAGWGNGDLQEIVDIVAEGVFEELDYRCEALNAEAFATSLAFLGYVRVPAVAAGFEPTPRVLVSEWMHGRCASKAHIPHMCHVLSPRVFLYISGFFFWEVFCSLTPPFSYISADSPLGGGGWAWELFLLSPTPILSHMPHFPILPNHGHMFWKVFLLSPTHFPPTCPIRPHI